MVERECLMFHPQLLGSSSHSLWSNTMNEPLAARLAYLASTSKPRVYVTSLERARGKACAIGIKLDLCIHLA